MFHKFKILVPAHIFDFEQIVERFAEVVSSYRKKSVSPNNCTPTFPDSRRQGVA
jgi:hypothetical protein